MVEINGKVYRNLQEQVEKNKEDIEDIKESGVGGGYTAGDGIEIITESDDTKTISIDNTVETKANATSRFVSKDNLTDYSINEIIVANSQVDSDTVDLRAVYSQDVKSEVSLDPTSTIIRTMSGTDTSTIGISATEIDVTTPMFKYGTSEVATKADIPTYTEGQGITITNSNEIKANIGYGLEFRATESDTDEIMIDTDVVATKEDLIDYHAGTNVNFTPHSGTSGFDINVPMKTINGNPINGIGNITLATLTEKFFRVNINWGNPVSKTWYYTFRAEASLDTTLTGITALYAYVPEGAIVYNPDDKCLYTIVSLVPNSQSTIAKYDGTTETLLTAGFVNTTVQAI